MDMTPAEQFHSMMLEKIPALNIIKIHPSNIPVITRPPGKYGFGVRSTIYPSLQTLTAATVEGLVNCAIKLLAVQYDRLSEDERKEAEYHVQYGDLYHRTDETGADVIELVAVVEVVTPPKEHEVEDDESVNERALAKQREEQRLRIGYYVSLGDSDWQPTVDDMEAMLAAIRNVVIERSNGQCIPRVTREREYGEESCVAQRQLVHITAGNDNWQPSDDELRCIVEMFQNADPRGDTIVVTRPGIELPSELQVRSYSMDPDAEFLISPNAMRFVADDE